MQKVIGIDFGTSTTYMNVKRYNGNQPAEDAFSYMPVMFNYGESSGYIVTIARENADGTFDFGEKATEEMDGAKIHTEIKMYLESPDEAQRLEARRIVKEFFKFLYATYAQQAANLGSADDTEETVISYPVKWKQETAEFMLAAATEAGFQNVRGMDEATAAVSTVLCHSAELIDAGPGYLLLVDMGAGTTDLVVCQYQADAQGRLRVSMVNSWPQNAQEPCFGGREIDRLLEQYVENYLSKEPNPLMSANAHTFATRPGEAKKWKELNVSVSLAANKQVTTCGYLSSFKTFLSGSFPVFGRQEFERFAQTGLQDYVKLLMGCLTDTAAKDQSFEKKGLDLVILTGGHSAWYFAREILDGTMTGYLEHPALAKVRGNQNRVVNLPNPQTTVSLGLVYSKLPFKVQPSVQEQPPVQAEPPVEATLPEKEETCGWVELVRYVVNTAPDLVKRNRAMEIDHKEFEGLSPVIYLDDLFMDPGCGVVICEDGIMYTETPDHPVSAMLWEEFAASTLIDDGHRMRFCYGDQEICSHGNDDREGLLTLRKTLRQYFGFEEKERCWDPRLLPVIKKFVKENPVLNSKLDCMGRYEPDDLLRQVELEHLVGDEIYHASDEFTMSLLGRNKRIITSSGFGIRYHFLWGYGGEFVTWEEFFNADLTDQSTEVYTAMRCIDMEKEFVKLQKLLWQEADKLI